MARKERGKNDKVVENGLLILFQILLCISSAFKMLNFSKGKTSNELPRCFLNPKISPPNESDKKLFLFKLSLDAN